MPTSHTVRQSTPAKPAPSPVASAGRSALPWSRRRKGAVVTARGSTASAAVPRARFTSGRVIAPSVASSPPAVQAAWNEGMTGRPRRCSMATACMFDAASLAPSPSPYRPIPATSTGRLPVPRVDRPTTTKPAATSTSATRTASALSATRATRPAATEPAPARSTSSSIRPASCRSESPKRSFSCGRRRVSEMKSRPCTRNAAATAVRWVRTPTRPGVVAVTGPWWPARGGRGARHAVRGGSLVPWARESPRTGPVSRIRGGSLVSWAWVSPRTVATTLAR